MRRRAIRSERLRKLAERAEEHGWSMIIDGAGHVRLTSPSGTGVFVISATANDRALGHHYQNARASARRAGLDVKGL